MKEESLMLVLLRLSFWIVFAEEVVLKESTFGPSTGVDWPALETLSVGVLWSNMIGIFGCETGVGSVASGDNWCWS